MKKTITIFLLLCISLMIISGCGEISAPNESQNSVNDNPSENANEDSSDIIKNDADKIGLPPALPEE